MKIQLLEIIFKLKKQLKKCLCNWLERQVYFFPAPPVKAYRSSLSFKLQMRWSEWDGMNMPKNRDKVLKAKQNTFSPQDSSGNQDGCLRLRKNSFITKRDVLWCWTIICILDIVFHKQQKCNKVASAMSIENYQLKVL